MWAVGIEPGWVVLQETGVPIGRWPTDRGPLRIAALAERVLLTLAGHTHGGQVNLPVLGRLIVPSQFGDRYAIGHIHEEGRELFVSPGIGTSIVPVRFRVPPEISPLTVEP